MNLFLFAVLFAALLDVGANLLLAASDGFRKRRQGFCALLLVGLAFASLSYAVRGMDLAVAYAMWGGFGLLGTMLGGWFFLKQKPHARAWLGALLLLVGMVTLHSS